MNDYMIICGLNLGLSADKEEESLLKEGFDEHLIECS